MLFMTKKALLFLYVNNNLIISLLLLIRMSSREKHIEYSSNVVRTLNPSLSPREMEFDNKIGEHINTSSSSSGGTSSGSNINGSDDVDDVSGVSLNLAPI